MAWMGTARQIPQFDGALDVAGAPIGVPITGSCSRKVEFLDTIVDISDGVVRTRLFVKPTDSPTYLKRRSYHNQHVFKALPYSQFRRAVVVCSDISDREEAIVRQIHKVWLQG